MANALRSSVVVLVLLATGHVPGWAQESVQTAQTLYASASYDEALAVLERLQHQDLTPSEVRVVHQQRALCLLALGRTQDANQAIAAAVQADPVYRHGEASASPRVRNAFRDVRARLLPGIVQSEYVEARRLYDTSSWAPAAAAFQRVVALATDGDLSEAQVKALADLRILADGFARLAATAATPPPPPEPVAPSPPTPPPPPPVDYGRVFDSSDPEVVGPVTVRQDLPRWTAPSPVPRVIGLLEVIIAKNGVVERATLMRSISTAFDRQVLDGTKHWRYEPALVNGQPVRFKKTIKITFQ